MQIRNGEPPGIDLTLTRRAALGSMLAVVLTPTLLTTAAEKPALGQQPPTVMAVPRTDHTITLMGDGSVLVAGGRYLGILSDVQIYNLGTNTWSQTGSLNTPRTMHAAAMMGDGSVIVSGGRYLGTMSDSEQYNPSTGLWAPIAPMNIPRYGHSASQYNGGVLVYGGFDLGIAGAPEFYDGATWTLL